MTPPPSQSDIVLVAEFDGAKIVPPEKGYPYWSIWFGDFNAGHWVMDEVNHEIPTLEDCLRWHYIPDYPNSLDALHRVLLKFNPEQMKRFTHYLSESILQHGCKFGFYELTGVAINKMLRATPQQVFDAIVAVLKSSPSSSS